MYTNACSVIGKMDELSIRASNYDIIGITETWGSCDISDAELSLPGFQMFRVDRGTKGGGVLLYVWPYFSRCFIVTVLLLTFGIVQWRRHNCVQ